MNKREIPVFFSIDDSYAPFLSVALKSAIENSNKENNYKAIVLYQELSAENMKKLGALEVENFKIEFVPMQGSLEVITDRMSNRLRCDYFTLTIYFRLFIPEMFLQYDKGIYIDSDVVVTGDLAELFAVDLGTNLIAACQDHSVVDVPELVNYMENAVGVDRYEYINSGVLLMNLKALREAQLSKHFLELLAKYHFDCIAPDQDYLNAICNGRIHYLSEKWDTMPTEGRTEADDVKLIHYNLFSKPWCYDNIQYGDYFWKYAEHSGYIDEIRAFKASYSEEQKDADSKCLELLIQRGNKIPDMDITFKKVYESGVKVRL